MKETMIRMKYLVILFMAWIPVCLMADNRDAIIL